MHMVHRLLVTFRSEYDGCGTDYSMYSTHLTRVSGQPLMTIMGSGLRVVFVLRIRTKSPLKVNEAGLAAGVSTNLILIVCKF